ncbi:MAG: hypothetical protein ACKO9Z_01635 [Planctomycetota bacterium]
MAPDEKWPAKSMLALVAIVGLGLVGASFTLLFIPEKFSAVLTGWLVASSIFAVPMLARMALPSLGHPVSILAVSGFRLVSLPMILLCLKRPDENLEPFLLGWTLSVYVLNLFVVTMIESKAPA